MPQPIIENITAGDLSLDNQTGVVEIGDRKVFLTGAERTIFSKLLLAHGNACKRNDLYLALFGLAPCDKVASRRVVDPLIKRIRDKVPHVTIQTVKHVGYVLNRVPQ
jgi:DNA-binding response OmpR family regulator